MAPLVTRIAVLPVVALALPLSLRAQEAKASDHAPILASVPFIGCRSEGQAEILNAPKERTTSLPISGKAAQALAYYASALDLAVLAPRGWYCLGIYGSGGDFLFVSPQPIDTQEVFAPRYRGFHGPAIEISERHSDQNGDINEKIKIIARVFPAYKALVAQLVDGFDIPPSEYPFGPYPSDKLTYVSKSMVEYITPAKAEGLGTHSSLKKNAGPIRGVAILNGDPPDVILLSVRLPEGTGELAPAIIHQVEREILRHRR